MTSELSARGYVYALVWERAPGTRFTIGEIKREAIERFGKSSDRKLARIIERFMANSTIERPINVLHAARIVRREGRDKNGAVVWVRERLPKRFSSDLLVVRGGGRRAVTHMLDTLVHDRQLELADDGLYRDTREAS